MIPLGSVAVTFLPGNEPGGEAAFASPISGAGLVLRRATAVIVASLVCLIVGSLALPDLALRDAAWLLPSLALTFTALAVATWRPIELVAGALAVGWFALVAVAGVVGDSGALERSSPFGTFGQLLALAVAALAAAVFARRRKHFIYFGGWSWN